MIMRSTAMLAFMALALLACGGSAEEVHADAPELASWKLNTTGVTGYNGLPANVQRVRYSDNYVYVNASGIPDYTIGPWAGNPNSPTNQNFLFKIARHPVVNNGTKTATGLGPIGVWVNGVALFNALDAHSYNNRNIWHQDAVYVEAPSFDGCLGHPAPFGAYHHHQNPRCLHIADGTVHSPILGFAYDGFPVYGPYGYASADGTGGVSRMRTSYRLRNITQRTTLPDGTALQPINYGPAVSATYPLGYYVEDYEYVAGLGDLDAHNGRFCVTPEYPGGTYAYFTTITSAGASAYPYAIGPAYYGVVVTENVSTGGHVTITESVSDYVPGTSGASDPTMPLLQLGQNAPNPFHSSTRFAYSIPSDTHVTIRLLDVSGRVVSTLVDGFESAGAHVISVPAGVLAPGCYFYQLTAGSQVRSRKMLIVR
jgi:hypothetical protein